jgi:hypothetical protein
MFGKFRHVAAMRLQHSLCVAPSAVTLLENTLKALAAFPFESINYLFLVVCSGDMLGMKKDKPLTKKERDEKRKKHKEKQKEKQ